MRIDVTREHIANGKRKCAEGCPIALALVEQVGWNWVEVGNFTVNSPLTKSIAMPEEARQFVQDFDNEKAVDPFVFEIEVA